MNKSLLILFCFFLLSFSFAQNNLVKNPSFENVSSADKCKCTQTGNGSYYEWVDYWNCNYAWTCPELKQLCRNFIGVGTADWDCIFAHTGIYSGFCAWREYIIQNIAPMVQGHVYYIEYWVKGKTALTDAGLCLFEERPKQCGGSAIKPDRSPQAPIPYGLDITNWTKVSSFYTADKAYSWIGLGNFNTKHTGSGASYYFDDISIIEVGSSPCPDINYIQNTYLQDIGKITYKSQNLTIAGNNVASTIAQGNVVIDNNAIVEFKSAKQVILEPGFSVEPGAYFEARIAPCDADCYTPVANAGEDTNSCGNQTIQLGTSSEFDVTYSWTANPSSALAYLSNPNSSNPTFTSPALGNGKITYILKATNHCGTSVTDNVIITYDANPSNSPSVSVSNIIYSDLIEFDANFGSHTEQLIVEVFTASGSLVNSYTYILGVDFNCCSYHWKIPAPISPCTDYVIKIKTKNSCSLVFSEPFIINWIRNKNLGFIAAPNIITNSQPSWCFTFTGGTQYHLIIYNRYGTPIYISNGTVSPPSVCAWNGECNQPICTQPNISDGTYYYDLTITGCDGSTISKPGFITVILGNKTKPQTTGSTQDTLTANGNSQGIIYTSLNAGARENNQIEIEFFPNPTTGIFSINLTGSLEQKMSNKITIYDATGTIIQKTEMLDKAVTIDISSHAKGMYFIKFENEQGIKLKKIIYQ